jgi:uncharacterized protein with von Willebrand factor type A (vWA) domain
MGSDFSELSGTDSSHRLSISNKEIIESVVSIPRMIPRDIREEIASLIVTELMSGETIQIKDSPKFIQKYGVFYPILIHLRHSETWQLLKELSLDSPEAAVPVLQTFLTKIFDLIDLFPNIRDGIYSSLDDEMKDLLVQFEKILDDTRNNWAHDVPLFENEISRLIFEYSSLLSQINPENLINDIISQDFAEDCSESTASLETMVNDPQYINSILNPDELKSLITELKQKIESLKKDLSDSPGSTGQGEGTEQGNGSVNGAPNAGNNSKIQDISQIIKSIIESLQKNKMASNDSVTLGKKELIKNVNNFTKKNGSDKLIQKILQSSTLDSVNSMIQSIKPHVETINFLVQLFPGNQWNSEIADLKIKYIQNLEKYAKFVEKNDELKTIIKLIGRIELEYGVRKRSISPMGRSEMHSITRSNDIARLLPAEASKFHHPLLKKKLYADFTEGKLLTYELRGKHWTAGPPKKKERGPVVALVDTSGSMNGSPEIIAKTIVLALSKRMLKEERDVKVILFSGPGNTVEIDLTSKKKMALEFLNFLSSSFGGGTDFDTALKSGLDSLKQPAFKGADLLFITDGVSEISKSLIDEWDRVKKEQDARVFSLIIGANEAGELKPISDYTYFVQKDQDWILKNSPASMIRFIASTKNPEEAERQYIFK